MHATPTAVSSRIAEVDLDESILVSPYGFYATLRRTAGLPRHRRQRYFLVSRYDDIRDAVMRTEDFSSAITDHMVAAARLGRAFEGLMGRAGPIDVLAVVDAPRHIVHRKLATRHFAREPVAALVDAIGPVVDRRVDRFVAEEGGEFVARVSHTLPAEVALRLLGLPIEDADVVKAMSDASVALLSGMLPRSGRLASLGGALGLYVYSANRLRQALARGSLPEPLGDAIVQGVRTGDLGFREGASIVMQMLVAGADSTTSLLGSAAHLLATNPALAQTLRDDPSKISAFVEEVLRLESPFQGHFRVVRRPTSLSGQRLEPGDRLMLLWAAGNRDESAFDRPDELRLDRGRSDKPQLAFGLGPHLCLGASVARAVSRRALESLLLRTSSIELAASGVTYKPSGFVRTLERLPLRVRGVRASPSHARDGAGMSVNA